MTLPLHLLLCSTRFFSPPATGFRSSANSALIEHSRRRFLCGSRAVQWKSAHPFFLFFAVSEPNSSRFYAKHSPPRTLPLEAQSHNHSRPQLSTTRTRPRCRNNRAGPTRAALHDNIPFFTSFISSLNLALVGRPPTPIRPEL